MPGVEAERAMKKNVQFRHLGDDFLPSRPILVLLSMNIFGEWFGGTGERGTHAVGRAKVMKLAGVQAHAAR